MVQLFLFKSFPKSGTFDFTFIYPHDLLENAADSIAFNHLHVQLILQLLLIFVDYYDPFGDQTSVCPGDCIAKELNYRHFVFESNKRYLLSEFYNQVLKVHLLQHLELIGQMDSDLQRLEVVISFLDPIFAGVRLQLLRVHDVDQLGGRARSAVQGLQFVQEIFHQVVLNTLVFYHDVHVPVLEAQADALPGVKRKVQRLLVVEFCADYVLTKTPKAARETAKTY